MEKLFWFVQIAIIFKLLYHIFKLKKPYKTKKRKAEFKHAYEKIGECNRYINNYEIEIQNHIKYGRFDEAISIQEIVNRLKIELLELGKEGWDIEYTSPGVSGLYVIQKTPEL